jgi:hypothetical protein
MIAATKITANQIDWNNECRGCYMMDGEVLLVRPVLNSTDFAVLHLYHDRRGEKVRRVVKVLPTERRARDYMAVMARNA